jgi:hypothetical protein
MELSHPLLTDAVRGVAPFGRAFLSRLDRAQILARRQVSSVLQSMTLEHGCFALQSLDA